MGRERHLMAVLNRVRPDHRLAHRMGGVTWFTANTSSGSYTEAINTPVQEHVMSHVTDAELVEIVPDLRALALVETSAEVRAALTRLADRYAAMAVGFQHPAQAATACQLAA